MDPVLISVFLIIFAVLLLMGVPVAFCMLVASFAFILSLGGALPQEVVPQRMMVGIDVFTFLAIPLFLLAGLIMNAGGITARLVRFAQGIVGFVRGGLAYVNVASSMLMSGMSGSALADAAGSGAVLINSMEKAGYRKGFAAALTSASATIGPIIPPSIPFILYASIAQVSVADMFLAGIIPGLLMGVCLAAMIGFLAQRQGFPKEERLPFKDVAKSFLDAFLALLMPVIILGGIFSGVFTATEAAAVAVVYALGLTILVYRELRLGELPNILFSAAKSTAVIMIIVSAAALFGWLLAQQRIPGLLAESVTSLTDNLLLVLLFINLMLLVLGMFMEGTAILIILTPVLLPLVTGLGIDPVHFGVIIVLNLMVGLITPPIGLTLFITAGIARINVTEVIGEIPPFIVALGAVLLLVTYAPSLFMWLPEAIN